MQRPKKEGGITTDEEELEYKPPKPKFNYRSAKIMHDNGKSYKEIAEKFGTTENYVKKMMYETRKKRGELANQPPKPGGRPKGRKNDSTVAKEKMLTNWQKSSMSPAMREDKSELNRYAGWFVTECLKTGQKVDRNNIDSLYEALAKYIELCTTSGMPMLIKTCQLALGLTNPQTLPGWKNGTIKSNDPRYKKFAELAYAVVGAGIEAAAAAGSIDRVLTIWWEKAHFNMIEGNGVEKTEADPLGERVSNGELLQKYAELLPDDEQK